MLRRLRLAPLVTGILYVLLLTIVTMDRAATRTTIAVVALAVLTGVVVGVVAEVLVFLRGMRTRRRVGLLHGVVLAAAVHVFFVAWSMADAPATFADSFYARGGLARTVQVLACDTLGKAGLFVAAALLAFAYVRPRRVVLVARRVLRPLWLASALSLGMSCTVSAPRRDKPDVLLIVAPALRSDRLAQMPVLTRFGEEHAIRFERAYVSSTDGAAPWIETLAGSLRAAGYTTATLRRGEEMTIGPAAVRPAAARVFRAREIVLPRTTEPGFVAAVLAPRRLESDPRYRGRFKYTLPEHVADAKADADDARQLRLLNDAAARSMDVEIERLLAQVDLDRTIVIVTALRGQSLFENDRGYEGELAGDESTHVPLFVHDPSAPRETRGRREASVVRDVDVAPTILELAGVAAPSDLEGRSLRKTPLEPRPAFAEASSFRREDMPYPAGDAELALVARPRMARDDRWKLLYVPRRSGPRFVLFDTESDPGETTDVASEHDAEVARLGAHLFAWMLRDRRVERRDGFVVPRGAR